MIHNIQPSFFRATISAFILVLACGLLGMSWGANPSAVAQKLRAKAQSYATQQPLYSDYKGVRIGMSLQEVRGKLGEPLSKAADQDFYVFSEKETAQIAYNASKQVMTISVDYLGGVGAPEYKAVIGEEAEVNPNGSIYKLIHYESLGFWVSFNRSAGNVPVVTVTIQAMK
jgi:hypothetical protein